MSAKISSLLKLTALVLTCAGFLTGTGLRAQTKVGGETDLLREIAKTWNLMLVEVGGPERYRAHRCGEVSITSQAGTGVSFSAVCGKAGKYHFALKPDSEPQTYLVTLSSEIGISVRDFPISFGRQGWSGAQDILVDGKTKSTTAMVAPIEGRNWYGWRIFAVPTAAIGGSPGEVETSYLMADLTQRK